MVSAPAHVQSMCALPSLSLSLYEQNFLGILQAPGHISPLALIKTRWAGGRPFFFFLFLDRKRFTWPKAPPSGVFSRGDFVSRAQGGGQLVLAWQTGVDLGQARGPAVQGQSAQGQRVTLEE